MDDPNFNHRRQKFYERFHQGSANADTWHTMARRYIHKTTYSWFWEFNGKKQVNVLNAGSGGSDYGISMPMIHFDVIALPSVPSREFIQGNVERIPFPDASFDVVLCVGSVLNYCDPTLCLSEISRILKSEGFAILEYERSGSAEYIWQPSFASAASRFVTFFGGETTYLWAYSDRFVEGIMAVNGLKVIRSRWFHCLSALALAVSHRPRWSANFAVADCIVSKLPLFRAMASNRILVIKKITHYT